ncbi:hypothetical protein GALMADRAFT_126319 [Galerina marginata CBS 339.88]|uniref:DUF6534 domain-containing protein n=1 Tax=Galerina marginata (strain CBS 339.88) TaxID=685588 RepID=A0A067SP55_GALM3|nr:hypothetical protein GALMADRAFT_126319 [Galerina marginata CBS 339.88]
MESVGFVHVDLIKTIGALQIGSLFGVYLFGIVSLQAHNYYKIHSDDGWTYKLLVAAIWLLETGHTLCISYEVYRVTIIQYGEPQFLVRFQAMGVSTLFGGLITLLVQGFFSIRIFRLLPKPYNHIGTLCLVASLVRIGISIFLMIEGVLVSTLVGYNIKYKTWISVTFILGASIDVTIAASMLYYLLRKRSIAMKRLTRIIDRLITYTIRSGLVTSMSAVILTICYRSMNNNFIWMAVYTFLAKLYSNSLLSALNSRQEIRNDANRMSVVNFPTDLNLSGDSSVPSSYGQHAMVLRDKAPMDAFKMEERV